MNCKKISLPARIVLLLALGLAVSSIAAPDAHAVTKPYLLVDSSINALLTPINPVADMHPMPGPAHLPEQTYPDMEALNNEVGGQLTDAVTASPDDCVVPDFEDQNSILVPMYVNGTYDYTVQLCPGTYTVPENFGPFQVVFLWGDNATIDCNGATLIGSAPENSEVIEPWKKMGIASAYWANNVTIQNCTLGGFGYGIFVGGGFDVPTLEFRTPKKVTIANNSFSQYSYADMVVSAATDSDIYGNTRTTGNSTFFPTIMLENVTNSRMYDNTLYSQQGMGVRFESNYNQIYANRFGHEDPSYNQAAQLLIDHGSAYNQVHDNVFEQYESQGIVLLTDDPDHDLYRPTGGAHHNEIYRNAIDQAHNGFYMNYGVHHNSVFENTLTNIGDGYGIFLSSHVYDEEYQGPYSNYFRKNLFRNGHTPIMANSTPEGNDVIRDNLFTENKAYNFTYGPDDRGFDMYDENGVGNYWNTFDEPEEGCLNVDENKVCDTLYPIGPYLRSFDHFPVSGVPILQPLGPFSANEPKSLTVRLSAWDPNGDPLTYAITDSRFKSMAWCWPGTNDYRWQTDRYSSGSYTFTATASDGEHVDSQPFTVKINDTCYIDKWGKWSCAWSSESLQCSY